MTSDEASKRARDTLAEILNGAEPPMELTPMVMELLTCLYISGYHDGLKWTAARLATDLGNDGSLIA